MLRIQKYLREHSLAEAVNTFALSATESGNLVSLNYSMTDKRGVPESEECRGLVLEKGTWNVVAYPFYRFYNAHEVPYAWTFNNWDPAYLGNGVLLQKLDGTMCTMYFYDGTWRVATRSRAFADGDVGNNQMTFADLFWKTIEQYKVDWDKLPRDYNYVFELTSPYNRIVTPYTDNQLHLLTVRDIGSPSYPEIPRRGVEVCANTFLHIPLPVMHQYKNRHHIESLLSSLPALQEGFVLVYYGGYYNTDNQSYPRVKIKNPKYLKAHSLIGSGFDQKKALGLVLSGGDAEFVGYFPDYADLITDVANRFYGKCHEIENTFNSIFSIDDTRKQFAEKAKKYPYAWVLFQLLTAPISGNMASRIMCDPKRFELVSRLLWGE